MISGRSEIGILPDVNESVFVISRITILPLNQMSAKDLDIMVCHKSNPIQLSCGLRGCTIFVLNFLGLVDGTSALD